MDKNNYNTHGSDSQKEINEEKPIDQTTNSPLLDKESRIDSNSSKSGDPELKWGKRWKLKDTPENQVEDENQN